MTASQPRRTRRRQVPSTSLPRPTSGETAQVESAASSLGGTRGARRPSAHMREHHVTTDYTYVHKDLLLIAGVGAIVIAFIVAMSFVL